MSVTALVGVDVQSVEEVEWSLNRFGDRYSRRLFSREELSECTGDTAIDARILAGKFAAKEAVLKVLDLQGAAPGWTSIELRCRSGRDVVVLGGEARQLAELRGVRDLVASVSVEAGVAIAAVIADENEPLDQEGR